MEESILGFSKALGKSLKHIESSTLSLKQSLDRRPILLGSASNTFIQCLKRRAEKVSEDLNLLEPMVLDTVSLEELLGHCNELYKKNDSDLWSIETRLVENFNYVPPAAEVKEEVEASDKYSPFTLDFKMSSVTPSPYGGRYSATGSVSRSLEDDPLLEESLSLKNLGISDVTLASLASRAKGKFDELDFSLPEPKRHYEHKVDNLGVQYRSITRNQSVDGSREHLGFGKAEDNLNTVEVSKRAIVVSKEEYECISSSMKSLASWEDLLAAVEKINSSLSKKEKTTGCYFFHQDEISSLELGPKARCYLLMLLKMNRLVIETIDGKISYRIL